MKRFKPIGSFSRGHKLFLDQEWGKVAIADHSGPLPSDTDDGVIWFKECRGGKLVFVLESSGLETTTLMPQSERHAFEQLHKLTTEGRALETAISMLQHNGVLPNTSWFPKEALNV